MRTKYLAAAILAASLLGRPAAGQSIADLLQKGIYNQETAGDLDAAIQIYRQVVASGTEARNYAAQAQFRLGVCLLKKGDNAAAVKAFEQLLADYPEQKELAAKAREYMPADFKLLPAPWAEGELLEYEIKTGGGMIAGTMLLTVEPNPARPGNLVLKNRTYTPSYTGAGPTQHSRVEVERDSMKPVSLTYFNMALGQTRIDYDGRQARVQSKGKEASILPLGDPTFDNEEAIFLVRRLPLAAGYKVKLPLVSPMGVPLKLEVAVLGIEDVEVPAGKFRCHKFEFAGIPQKFWIAMDAPRPIVKIDVGAVSIELASMRRVDPLTPLEYRDAKTGLAVTAAPGWILKPNPMMSAADETSVHMYDPEVKAFAAIWGKMGKSEKSTREQRLRAEVDSKAKSRAGVFKDYRVRPESVQLRQIAGQQALSCIADYSDSVQRDHAMIEYLVWVETDNSICLFFARVAASDFEEFRKRFDPIVETVRLK